MQKVAIEERMEMTMQWIHQNLATILICLGLVVLVGAIIASMIRDKKQGKNSCGCNCSGCAMGEFCHKNKD